MQNIAYCRVYSTNLVKCAKDFEENGFLAYIVYEVEQMIQLFKLEKWKALASSDNKLW